MKGRDLLKIIFCFLLFQAVTGSNQLIAGSYDQSLSGSQPADKGKEMPEELKAETDQHLCALWEEMRTALSNSDIETAMSYFTEKSRKTYGSQFAKVSDEKRRELAENWEDLQLVKFHSDSHAEHDILEIRDDEEVFWHVDFIKNQVKANGKLNLSIIDNQSCLYFTWQYRKTGYYFAAK